MRKMLFDTTVCAPACPPGGALSIIRISGPDTFSICEKLVNIPGQEKSISDLPANTIHYAWIYDSGRALDEVMVSIFKAPHSYTGEDSLEITCHGSPYIQKRVTDLLIRQGAVLAKPGEFTLRAFMHGKLDLIQAEAVADLIASETQTAHRIAMHQMRGGISQDFKNLRKQLINLMSLIELELDFSDEDVEFAKRDELKNLVTNILEKAEHVYNTFELGNALKNGVPVAIIGKPNVGKSTLLNLLVNDERAIVSEIAGTTRDAIEDTIIINGILFRFIDTAGIRETADVIENLGIRKTYQKIDMASVILFLLDARDDLAVISDSIEEIRKQINGGNKSLVLIVNMSDLVNPQKLNLIQGSIKLKDKEYLLTLSAATGYHLDELSTILTLLITHDQLTAEKTVISNIRHMEALQETIDNLRRVLSGLEEGLPEDLIAHDLRQSAHYLGTITGEVGSDEVLGNIFRNFCIGK